MDKDNEKVDVVLGCINRSGISPIRAKLFCID
jgi:hypothetical protein